MGSGPVCAMVWEGKDVVKTGRVLLGATNPLASAPGTIRGDFAIVSLINMLFAVCVVILTRVRTGCRPQRLPRLRRRRVGQEGDCSVVRQEGDSELEVRPARLDLREIDWVFG